MVVQHKYRSHASRIFFVGRNNSTVFGEILMATTSLGIHYFIKDGHRDTVLSKLKGVIELCTKEPEFINAIISETSERPQPAFLA